jgi:hypothetical protein
MSPFLGVFHRIYRSETGDKGLNPNLAQHYFFVIKVKGLR